LIYCISYLYCELVCIAIIRTKNDDYISHPFINLNPFVSKNPFYSSNPFYVNEQETNKIRNFHYGGASVANKAYDYKEEEDYDDDDYDDDDDDDYDDDEEEEEGALPSSNMSLSLMKALGMDTAGVDEVATDWRPPSQSGLQHSTRKIDNYHEMLLIVFCRDLYISNFIVL